MGKKKKAITGKIPSCIITSTCILYVTFYLPNRNHLLSGCILLLIQSETIFMPATEKVIPLPPNPKTK
jgi:hypothetical protein